MSINLCHIKCLNECKDYLLINQILLERKKAACLIQKNYKIYKNKQKIKNLIFISNILIQRKKKTKNIILSYQKLFTSIKNKKTN